MVIKTYKDHFMSYMQLCLKKDGKEDLYLKVPTLWDDVEKQWIGFIQTPTTKKLITAQGKDSFSLQNSFNVALKEVFDQQDSTAQELFDMFMPAFYWEKT